MSEYSAKNIQILEGLEAVRKRPGMYIGSTGSRGLHHLVWEIVDNSIDEALAGYATTVKLTVKKDNYIVVEDDGRGIPVDIHPKTGRPAVETILTTLHAGGKFDGQSYKVSGGLHGVGASVVNALSSSFRVEINRDGKKYIQNFSQGEPVSDLQIEGKSEKSGSKVTFLADKEVFTETQEYNFETLRARIQQLAFLNKGINLIIKDEREEKKQEKQYRYEGGIVEYVNF